MEIQLFKFKTGNFYTDTLLKIDSEKVIISFCNISKSNKVFRGKSDYECYLIVEKKGLLEKLNMNSDEDLAKYFGAFQKDFHLFKNIRADMDKKEINYQFSVW